MAEAKLSTKRTGWLGESAVVCDLISKGMDVYLPVVDDNLCDLVVDTGKNIRRVQVKSRVAIKRGTSVEVKCHKYKGSSIDVIAIHYITNNMIAYVPYKDQDSLNLAVSPAKNNQEMNRDWFYRYMEFPI